MAAGIGSRLKQLSGNKPKCLIEANGETLISRSVSLLQQRGIDSICVVTGYKSECIHDELEDRVSYFHNPYYEVTNSIASLWLAREMLSSDVILMNADIYYENAVLDLAMAQTSRAVMLSDCTRIKDADFRFGVQADRILITGNQLSDEETDCEYVGIVRIDRSFIKPFKARLETMVERGDLRNWWEGVLYEFIDDGIDIFHRDVEGAFWTEIDHLGDYDRLTTWIASNHGLESWTVYDSIEGLAPSSQDATLRGPKQTLS
jgi:choline kinase